MKASPPLTEVVPAAASVDAFDPAALLLRGLPPFAARVQLIRTQVADLKLLEVLHKVRVRHPEIKAVVKKLKKHYQVNQGRRDSWLF